MKKIAIHFLGCKVNQEESAALSQFFLQNGWQIVPFEEEADVYIVNTCTVTHLADRKSRQLLRRAHKQNPQALVVATGCYAQVSPEQVAGLEGVCLVAGNAEKANLLTLVEEALAQNSQKPLVRVQNIRECLHFQDIPALGQPEDRIRANLKIEDGCNQFCNYCIVPYARGPVRSKPPEQVLTQAIQLVQAGYPEIVLTGIHIGAYGSDDPAAFGSLAGLVASLAAIPNLQRLRLGSIEPQELNKDFLAVLAQNPNICPHLHIPLQAGADKTLAAMGRGYDTKRYAYLVGMAREMLPDLAVTTDVLVGFPGETEADFEQGLAFVESMNFAKVHVFPYSARAATLAATFLNQVSPQVKAKRAKELEDVSKAAAAAWAVKYVGKELKILLEQPKFLQGKEFWFGHTANYLPVMIKNVSGKKGNILQAKGVAWQGEFLLAEIDSL